ARARERLREEEVQEWRERRREPRGRREARRVDGGEELVGAGELDRAREDRPADRAAAEEPRPRALRPEGVQAGRELVQDDSEREDVRGGRDRLAAHALGREVRERSGVAAGFPALFAARAAREAEVEQD